MFIIINYNKRNYSQDYIININIKSKVKRKQRYIKIILNKY